MDQDFEEWRFKFSGIWRHVDWYVVTGVSDEHSSTTVLRYLHPDYTVIRLLRNVGNFYYMHWFIYQNVCIFIRGTRWHRWLRHCAISRRVADLITDGIIEIFWWLIIRPHYDLGVDSASNKWVPGASPGE